MLNYPAEILDGTKSTTVWIRSLSRQELHAVIQDKEIPSELLPELARNIPAKFLYNLACHKKLQPNLRVTILRRIFKADASQLKNEAKMDAYNSILKLRGWSEKELQITRSYIQEVTKLLKNKKKKAKKAKVKREPKVAAAVKVVERRYVRPVPLPLPDSTLSNVAKYLDYHRAKALWQARSQIADIEFSQNLACSMFDQAVSEFPALARKATSTLSMEDLLSFRIELNQGLHKPASSEDMQDFVNGYKVKMRGEFASAFLTHFDADRDKNEVLYELMVRACAFSEEDRQQKLESLDSAASKYEQYLESLEPVLQYDTVSVTQGGMATITFKTSLNLQLTNTSFKYWRSSEDESFGFPVKFTINFDRKTKLNICTVTFTKLLAGETYVFRIAALANGQEIKLAPSEFEVPRLPIPQYQGINTYFENRVYGAPVPFGGGGERRWMQF